jgi:hypothetical protein
MRKVRDTEVIRATRRSFDYVARVASSSAQDDTFSLKGALEGGKAWLT